MGEQDVKAGTLTGSARHSHLSRAARLAGEAFAYVDQDADGSATRRAPVGGMAGLFLALAAAAGLFVGF